MTDTEHALHRTDPREPDGWRGTETSDRQVRRISLRDLGNRREQITEELWSAATDIGFFQLVDHGIDAADVDRAFRPHRGLLRAPPTTSRPGTG